MLISYDHHTNSWQSHFDFTCQLIKQEGSKRICEIGGGANPLLPIDYIDSNGLEYSIIDACSEELNKAPDGYKKITSDILDYDPQCAEKYDLVISKMLAEHIVDGQRFHERVFKLLVPGGIAFHFFPTLCCPPLAINRIVPERLSAAILKFVQPSRKTSAKTGKFPAYYSWCYGPTRRQISRLRSLGYEVHTYVGFFGHTYYKKSSSLNYAHNRFTQWLIKHPFPLLTSGAFLVLRRPFGTS